MKFKTFTLIELMIVVAIIGILASILLPSLQKARERSKIALCVNNLKQLNTALHTYGIDSDGDNYADAYVTAENVTNWDDVPSINVSMLLASIDDNVTQESVSINFNGAAINSGSGADRRLRHIYSTTITLRNRLQ